MSYNIKTISVFEENLKKLAKKFPSIKTDFEEFLVSMEKNPEQGIPLGKNIYKIRMKISSKNKGKSGGPRIISHVLILHETVYLLTIYDKSSQNTVLDQQIKDLINLIEE